MIAPLGEEEWKLLSDLLTERYGLVFPPSRHGHLEHRLRPRLERLHLDTFGAYYRFLAYHPDGAAELQELRQVITNNETYFFRESHQLDLLASHLAPALAVRGASRPLRVLSAGCSSGEEPYSIAITLLRASPTLKGRPFQIDACDLSPHKLAQAREAIYDPSALRGCDDAARRAHFDEEKGRFHLRPEYRAGVQFFEINLAAAGPVFPNAPYDVIFCRNVLIYFSERAFDIALNSFNRALIDGGYLLLGHAESLIGRRPDFQPQRLDGSIVYQKRRTST